MDIYFACLILFATIAASFCAEPTNVEVNNNQQKSIEEAQPQKRGILSDCDGPVPVGLHGGFSSGVALHGDLALGLHGHGYAPGYSGGYASGYSGGYASGYSGSYLGSSGLLASGGILSSGAVGHIGHIGHAGTLGAVLATPQLVSHGYAPHAPILASSVVSSPVFSQPPILAAPAAIAVHTPTITKVHQVPVPVPVDRPVAVPYPVPKPVPVPYPVDRPVIVPKPVAVPHPVPYPVHHVVTKKVTVPYPVPVPAPSVSYSPPVIVGSGLYDHPYGHRSYGSGIYSSSYGPSIGSYGSSYGSSYGPSLYSSGVKVLSSPSYISSYRLGGYGGHSSILHGGYSGGYHSGGYHSGGYHSGGLSYHGSGGGLGFSIGTKYGLPLKFGLKYHHWK